MLAAFIYTISSIFGAVVNKNIFSKDRTNPIVFTTWLFLFLFLCSVIFVPFVGKIDATQVFEPKNIIYLLIVIILAYCWNNLYYRSLSSETLAEVQLMNVFQPILVLTFTLLIFKDERNYQIIFATIVSCLALVLSHMGRWKIKIDRDTKLLFLAIFLAALEVIFIKQLLKVYSPVMLYCLRTGLVTILFIVFNRQNLAKIGNKTFLKTFFVSIFGFSAMVFSYIAYDTIGVAETTLVALLYPVITTLISVKILGERIKKRKIIAMIVIILCIIYTLFK